VLTGDSGGVPWTGRDLPPGPFAGDDGSPDPAVSFALQRYTDALAALDGPVVARARLEVAVVAALAGARLFVPIVALTGEAAEMALVTVTGADGRRGLPVFSSPDALARWRPQARPVPVPARRAALSAVAEGCELLLLDPAGPVSYTVRRPALWALGQGEAWTPSYGDPQVAAVIGEACVDVGVRCRLEPGDQAELRIVLGLPPGLGPAEVDSTVTALTNRLSRDEIVAARVDSLELSVRLG
jgi:hypothetical protein